MADKPTSDKPKTETHIIETKDGPIKITQPKGSSRRHHGISVVLDTDDVVREQVGGFTNFLRDYSVVGLAVGFIIGQETNGVMKQLLTSFIQPWLQVLFGTDLSTRYATVHHGTTPIKLPWGAFIYTFIEFVVVIILIYATVKLLRLDKLKKK